MNAAAVVNLGLDDDALGSFGAGAIGGAVSPEVDALIKEAGLKRDQSDEALALLEKARALAPSHPGPLIALYRFHFYGHALDKARAVGEDALAIARAALGANFGDTPPDDDALRHDPAVRFYLFTLKGLAYLSLRMGDFDEARLMLAALRQLDPKDHLGGALLAHVLARREAADTPDAVDPLSAYPVRGWSGSGAKL